MPRECAYLFSTELRLGLLVAVDSAVYHRSRFKATNAVDCQAPIRLIGSRPDEWIFKVGYFFGSGFP